MKSILAFLLMCSAASAQQLPPAKGLPPQGQLPGQKAQEPTVIIMPGPPTATPYQGAPVTTRCWMQGNMQVCRSSQ